MSKHEWIGLMSLPQIKTVPFVEGAVSAADSDIGDPNETMTRPNCRHPTISNLYISRARKKQRFHFPRPLPALTAISPLRRASFIVLPPLETKPFSSPYEPRLGHGLGQVHQEVRGQPRNSVVPAA